jgi:hypothetical protein
MTVVFTSHLQQLEAETTSNGGDEDPNSEPGASTAQEGTAASTPDGESASDQASASESDGTDSEAEDERKVGEKGRRKAAMRKLKQAARASRSRKVEETDGASGSGQGVSAGLSEEEAPSEGLGLRETASGARGLEVLDVEQSLETLEVGRKVEGGSGSGNSEEGTESGSEGEASIAPSTAGKQFSSLLTL